MIEYTTGDILAAEAEALVNPVNTVGVMGKGLALQFKERFPKNFEVYRRACQQGAFRHGQVLVVPTGREAPRYIINFPTKRHFRERSRLEDIEAGLGALVEEVRAREIASLALPALGCGLGGLAWGEVRPRIEAAFAALPEVRVLLYAPG